MQKELACLSSRVIMSLGLQRSAGMAGVLQGMAAGSWGSTGSDMHKPGRAAQGCEVWGQWWHASICEIWSGAPENAEEVAHVTVRMLSIIFEKSDDKGRLLRARRKWMSGQPSGGVWMQSYRPAQPHISHLDSWWWMWWVQPAASWAAEEEPVPCAITMWDHTGVPGPFLGSNVPGKEWHWCSGASSVKGHKDD